MKRLFIIRHAKSSWEHPHLSDFERPLNHRGLHTAPQMGLRMRSRQEQPDLLLSSPAYRAKHTARLMAPFLGHEEAQIELEPALYHASVRELNEILHQLPDHHFSVAMFGHNPGLTEWINEIAPVSLDNLPTCGIASIDLPIDQWAEAVPRCGTLRYFDFPKVPYISPTES